MRNLILIVDDNAACAEPLQIALESLDCFEIRVAQTAAAAIAALDDSAERLALVITDLRMPSVSGFDLMEMMKANARLRQTPVIVISGDSTAGLPERVLQSGAVAFFTKPYSPLEVKRRLEELLI